MISRQNQIAVLLTWQRHGCWVMNMHYLVCVLWYRYSRCCGRRPPDESQTHSDSYVGQYFHVPGCRRGNLHSFSSECELCCVDKWFIEYNIEPQARKLALETVLCCPHWINCQRDSLSTTLNHKHTNEHWKRSIVVLIESIVSGIVRQWTSVLNPTDVYSPNHFQVISKLMKLPSAPTNFRCWFGQLLKDSMIARKWTANVFNYCAGGNTTNWLTWFGLESTLSFCFVGQAALGIAQLIVAAMIEEGTSQNDMQ